MSTCFVIQPFDGGKFDKRFEDVYEPAIRNADLEPYRVDRDPKVDVPIDAIEEGIRNAAVCLADITTDNPNVWYELGFAYASNKPVVMVCSYERESKKYPFDIQHRTILPYKVESTQDFENLKAEVTRRIRALMQKTDTLRQIREHESVAPVEGLSQLELVVLAAVASNAISASDGVSVFVVKKDVEQAGFTALGFTLGLQRLLKKDFLEYHEGEDFRGEQYRVVHMTEKGWDWIERNEDKFVLKREPAPF
jgi:hypothetical protein